MAARKTNTDEKATVRIADGSIVDVVNLGEHTVKADAPLTLPRDEAERLAAQSDHLTVEDA